DVPLLWREVAERASVLLQQAKEAADLAVGLPERETLRHERLRDIGRVELGRPGSHTHRLGVERHGREAAGDRGERRLQGVDRVEQRLLVLLEVAVIAEGKPVEDLREARERRRRTGGLG